MEGEEVTSGTGGDWLPVLQAGMVSTADLGCDGARKHSE